MKNNKHTRGPWISVKKLNGGYSVKSADATINDADITDTKDDCIYLSEADARLIAAAPKMLEALKDAHCYISDDKYADGEQVRLKIGKIIIEAEGI